MDRKGGGPDDSFSLEPHELALLCKDSKIAWAAMGQVNYERTEAEKGNVKFRRSLYVVKDMKAGDKFTTDNVRSIRPGFGIAPKYLDLILGKIAKFDIDKGTPIKMEFI